MLRDPDHNILTTFKSLMKFHAQLMSESTIEIFSKDLYQQLSLQIIIKIIFKYRYQNYLDLNNKDNNDIQ